MRLGFVQLEVDVLAVDDSLFDCDSTTEVLAVVDSSEPASYGEGDSDGPRATAKATRRNFENELLHQVMFDQ